MLLAVAGCEEKPAEAQNDPGTGSEQEAREAGEEGSGETGGGAASGRGGDELAQNDPSGTGESGDGSSREEGGSDEIAPDGGAPEEGVKPPPPPEPKLTAPDGTVIEPCPAEVPAGMACVEGGKFRRGLDDDPHSPKCDQSSYNRRKETNVGPSQEIWVQTYFMDISEVTYEAYQDCYEAKQCNKAGPKYRDFNRPKQAMTGANWFDAQKFCEAQGKRLPTEAEWERAARGPDNTMYPWGDAPEPTCETAVIMGADGKRSCGIEKKGSHPEKGRVLEVCQKPPGYYGLCDMVGNAEEWVFDWYVNSFEDCGEDCSGVNPMGPCPGEEKCKGHRYKTVRGGSWYWPKEHATGVHRRSHVASNDPYHHFGFRCAATLEQGAEIASADAGAPAAEATGEAKGEAEEGAQREEGAE